LDKKELIFDRRRDELTDIILVYSPPPIFPSLGAMEE